MSSKLEQIQNRFIALKGVVAVPTVKVIHIRTGRPMIIAVKDYNKHIHELQEELPEAVLAKKQEFDDNGDPIEDNFQKTDVVQNANMSSRITKTDLLTMSIDALYLLPEWQNASARQRSKCNNKTDVIELILAIRKQGGNR
jgi:hypothetical protein